METRHPAQGTVDAQTAIANAMTEDELLANVKDLATKLGWRLYHTHDSRHSSAGFPDLVLVRRGRLLFAELKTQRGNATAAQVEWLDELSEVRGAITVHLWRPRNWVDGIIERDLR